MGGVDFFADLAITGTVLGVDHTSTPDEVEEVLGPGGASDTSRTDMLTDFGLIEFGRHRRGPEDDWAVTYFGAQTHRLEWLAPENRLETALTDRYGPFPPRLDVEALHAAVQARGFALEVLPPINHDCTEYWEPTSRMGVIAVADESGWGPSGTVLKMLGPQSGRAWLRFRDRHKSFRQYADHLLPLSDRDRARWLDRREPEPGDERADWWAYLRSVVAGRAEGAGTDGAWDGPWWRLRLALDRDAAERGVDTADEAAVTLSLSLLGARGPDGAASAPAALDEAVARWLAAPPASLPDARRLCSERPLEPDEIRLSRRLRNQIHDLQACLPHVTSAAVADELREWLGLRSALLRHPVREPAA